MLLEVVITSFVNITIQNMGVLVDVQSYSPPKFLDKLLAQHYGPWVSKFRYFHKDLRNLGPNM